MFSNVPSMLQQQDFQASNRDMLEAARGGKTLAEAPKYVRGLCAAGERLADIKYDRRLDLWSVNWVVEVPATEIRIEAANQQGSAIVIDPAPQVLEVGTVFTIEGVTRYRSQLDDCIPREFVVTLRVEIGHRVICFYPAIDIPATVNELPKRGAKLTIKPCSESPIPPPSSRD